MSKIQFLIFFPNLHHPQPSSFQLRAALFFRFFRLKPSLNFHLYHSPTPESDCGSSTTC
jgi:hypothetical protein